MVKTASWREASLRREWTQSTWQQQTRSASRESESIKLAVALPIYSHHVERPEQALEGCSGSDSVWMSPDRMHGLEDFSSTRLWTHTVEREIRMISLHFPIGANLMRERAADDRFSQSSPTSFDSPRSI